MLQFFIKVSCYVFTVVNQKFLDKWDLKMNNAILAEPKHVPMYEVSISPQGPVSLKISWRRLWSAETLLAIACCIRESISSRKFFRCITSSDESRSQASSTATSYLILYEQVNMFLVWRLSVCLPKHQVYIKFYGIAFLFENTFVISSAHISATGCSPTCLLLNQLHKSSKHPRTWDNPGLDRYPTGWWAHENHFPCFQDRL